MRFGLLTSASGGNGAVNWGAAVASLVAWMLIDAVVCMIETFPLKSVFKKVPHARDAFF